jgi:hypothetical protein
MTDRWHKLRSAVCARSSGRSAYACRAVVAQHFRGRCLCRQVSLQRAACGRGDQPCSAFRASTASAYQARTTAPEKESRLRPASRTPHGVPTVRRSGLRSNSSYRHHHNVGAVIIGHDDTLCRSMITRYTSHLVVEALSGYKNGKVRQHGSTKRIY